MVDAYSPNFSLDGLGLDLSAVGRYDLCPRSGARRRAPSLSPPLAQKRVPRVFSPLRLGITTPLALRARRAPPLTRAPSTSSTRRSPLIGGLDSLIHNDHWRCVAPPRPRPSRETRRWRKHKAVTWGSRNSSAGELFSPLCVRSDAVGLLKKGSGCFSPQRRRRGGEKVGRARRSETRGCPPRRRARASPPAPSRATARLHVSLARVRFRSRVTDRRDPPRAASRLLRVSPRRPKPQRRGGEALRELAGAARRHGRRGPVHGVQRRDHPR